MIEDLQASQSQNKLEGKTEEVSSSSKPTSEHENVHVLECFYDDENSAERIQF